MKHLYTLNSRSNGSSGSRSTTPNTSPGYDALATRIGMPMEFLTKVLDAGWLPDPCETGADQRSALLAYLGTFDSPMNFSSSAPDDSQVARYNNRNLLPDMSTSSAHVQLALRLLDMGANPWAQDVDRRDVLDQAFSLQWWAMLDRLWADPACPPVADLAQRTLEVRHVSGPTNAPGMRYAPRSLPWVHVCAAMGQDTLLGELLDRGFDVNQRDPDGRTPLFYAMRASTVGLLIQRGADMGVMDAHQRNVLLHWSTPKDQNGAMEMRAPELVAMKKLVTPVMKAQQRTNPDAARAAQAQDQQVLFELVATGTKDALIKHLRSSGLTVDAQTTSNGRSLSLLAVASLAVMESRGKRNSAVASHLLDKVDDPWFESFPGVPDVVLAWLSACGDKPENKLLGQTEALLNERFGWHKEQGFVRFLDAFLPMAEALIERTMPTDRTDASPMAQAVAAAELRVAGQLHAKSPLPEAMRKWHLERDSNGHNYAWRWAAVATDGCLGDITPGQAHLVQSNLMYWAIGQLPDKAQNVDARYTSPMAPIGAMGLHAMLAHFGHLPQPGEWPPKGVYGSSFLDHAFVRAMHRGATLDSALPGFSTRMARILAQRPLVAQDLETRVLRQEAQVAMSPQAPKARPRARL